MTVELRDAAGKSIETAKTEPDGTLKFPSLGAGEYKVAMGSDTFAKPFGGVS